MVFLNYFPAFLFEWKATQLKENLTINQISTKVASKIFTILENFPNIPSLFRNYDLLNNPFEICQYMLSYLADQLLLCWVNQCD